MDKSDLGEPIAKPRQPASLPLPLKDINYEVGVFGLQQHVTVTLKYGNELLKPVEAIYTMPLPDEASVLAVKMKIGEKEVEAELKPRQEARKEYEETVAAGHHASLLEEERPNIFTMSVGGIEPGEEISVKVEYFGPVLYQGGGRLVVPLVVAPRFIPGKPVEGFSQGQGWSPDTDEVSDASKITPRVAPDEVTYTANIKVELKPGFPVKVDSPSHGGLIDSFELTEEETRTLTLGPIRTDRDFILNYATTSSLPTVTVDRSNFAPKGEEPMPHLMLQLVAGTTVQPKPIEVVLCLDRSGSMSGAKIEGLRKVAASVLGELRNYPQPVKAGVVMFDHRVMTLAKLEQLSDSHTEALSQITPDGGTEIGAALNHSLSLFEETSEKDQERCILLVTDGESEAHSFQPIPGIRVHCIGIDSAVDANTLKAIAKKTGGVAEFCYPGEDFAGLVKRMIGFISGPVVRNLVIEDLPKGAEVTGLSDLFLLRPTTITIRLPQPMDSITIRGKGSNDKTYEWINPIPQKTTTDLAALVWAKDRLREITDQDQQTKISLGYNILGPTTAFVAVSLKEVPGQEPQRIELPVCLPATWEMEDGWGGDRGISRRTVGFVGLMLSGDEVPVEECYFSSDLTLGFTSGLTSSGPSRSLLGRPSATKDVPSTHDPFASKPPVPSAPTIPPMTASPVSPEFQIILPPCPPILLDKAKDFLDACKKGESDQQVWEKLLELLDKARNANYPLWSELHKAMLFYILAELRNYGFQTKIPSVVKTEPVDLEPHTYWLKAMESLGAAVKS